MFESKRKKAAKEFQTRYNLTEAEMSQIRFVKVPNFSFVKGPKKVYIGQLTTDNFDLYKKINPLTPILEEKLNNAKKKFFELTSRFKKEEIFDYYKQACYEDLTDFLFQFKINSDGIRISYAPDTPAEVMQKVWDKADSFLNAICLYYVLNLKDVLEEYSKVSIFSMVRYLIKKEEIDFNKTYDEIRTFIIEKEKVLSRVIGTLREDWQKACIVGGL